MQGQDYVSSRSRRAKAAFRCLCLEVTSKCEALSNAAAVLQNPSGENNGEVEKIVHDAVQRADEAVVGSKDRDRSLR